MPVIARRGDWVMHNESDGGPRTRHQLCLIISPSRRTEDSPVYELHTMKLGRLQSAGTCKPSLRHIRCVTRKGKGFYEFASSSEIVTGTLNTLIVVEGGMSSL